MRTCWKLRTKASRHSQHVRVGATKSQVNVTTSTCRTMKKMLWTLQFPSAARQTGDSNDAHARGPAGELHTIHSAGSSVLTLSPKRTEELALTVNPQAKSRKGSFEGAFWA